jgi:hypothetical protein
MMKTRKPLPPSMKACGMLKPVELCLRKTSDVYYLSGLPPPLHPKSAKQSRRNRGRWLDCVIRNSAVGFAAMTDAANLDGVRISADEEKPVVSNAESKLFSSLQSFHVAPARFGKAMQRGENLHGDGLAEAADIDPGWIGPNNPFHFGS